MKVKCPGCMSVYNIDDTKIPEAGARVKCPKCQNVLVVKKPPPRPAVLQETGPNQEGISRSESAEINKDSSPQMKNCPYCGEVILAVATKCKHCGMDLTPVQPTVFRKGFGELFGILMLCFPVIGAMLIWFWVGSMNMLQNPNSALTFIALATVIITATLAAVEANQLGFGKNSSGKKETGPIVFFLGILLVWVISYPYYLYQRSKKGRKNLVAGGIIVALVFTSSLLSTGFALGGGFNSSVKMVKNGRLSGYPQNTLSEAINGFFGNPKWEAIKGQDGRTYVNAVGDISYDGKKAKAILQFKVDTEKDTFEINALEINDVPQNMLMLSALVKKMYQSIPAKAGNRHDSEAMYDLRNACTAQEAYYVDNERYADSINKLIGVYGLYRSKDVTVRVIAADGNHYVMGAFHKKGKKKYIVEGPGGTIREAKG